MKRGAGLLLSVVLGGFGPSHADHLASHLPSAPTIRCAGNEQIEVFDRHIQGPADTIQAHGNCRLYLAGSHVLARGTAVLATGNAQVTIDGSFVQGTQHAIKVTGNAVVRYRDSTVRGAIFAAAGGQAIDDGGNAVERLPDPVSAPLSPAAALRCGDLERVVLIHRRIDAQEDGIEVAAGCVLTLSDSYVRGRDWGLRIHRGGRATVRNSTIEAGDVGIVVTGGGILNVAGSSIPNGIRVVGDASVIDGGGNAWPP